MYNYYVFKMAHFLDIREISMMAKTKHDNIPAIDANCEASNSSSIFGTSLVHCNQTPLIHYADETLNLKLRLIQERVMCWLDDQLSVKKGTSKKKRNLPQVNIADVNSLNLMKSIVSFKSDYTFNILLYFQFNCDRFNCIGYSGEK